MNGNGKSTIAKDDRNGPKVLIQNNTQIKWVDIKSNEYMVYLCTTPKRTTMAAAASVRKEERKREKYI